MDVIAAIITRKHASVMDYGVGTGTINKFNIAMYEQLAELGNAIT